MLRTGLISNRGMQKSPVSGGSSFDFNTPSFFAPLLAGLTLTSGTGVFTFNRSTTAYVMGVGPADNAVDGQKAILCNVDEARFWGARRISANNWSTTYQDASAIPDANLRGYWSEFARSDVLGTTNAIRRTMTDAGWVNTTMTVGSAVGLDGVAAAGASLTAAGALSLSLFTTVLGAAVHTYSVWIRRKTGVGTIEITKDGGTSWTIVALTAAYQLFQVVTANVANPIVGFRITTNADAIEVDFNQLEVATTANPTPIPVNVNKAVDILTVPNASNFSGTIGTVYVEFSIAGSLAGANNYIFNSGTLQYKANPAGATLVSYDGVNANNLAALAITLNTRYKTAMSYSGIVNTGAMNAVTAGAKPFDGDFNLAANMTVGGTGGAMLEGGVRNARGWIGSVASASQLQTITT